jgi:hypothetical protein
MSLMAHTNTTRCEESELKAIPAPPWTPTWHPISHAQLIDATAAAVESLGIGVKNKQYSMNKTGTRMFACWDFDLGNGEVGYSLGFRHAIDRSMRIGYCAGTTVFICDNMCFAGTSIVFRMHTGGLDIDSLQLTAENALGGAVIEMEKLHEWQTGLHEIYVPKRDLKELAFDMATEGVFSPGQLNNYLTCLDEEKAARRHSAHGRPLDGATTLYTVHGAATRLMRNWNLLRTSESTAKLNLICDDYMERRAA